MLCLFKDPQLSDRIHRHQHTWVLQSSLCTQCWQIPYSQLPLRFCRSLIFTANRIPLKRENYRYTQIVVCIKPCESPRQKCFSCTFCWSRTAGVKLMWRDASWIFPLFHRKWVLPCWVTAILFKSWSLYFVILSTFLEYHSFHFNTVAFISKMNSSLLGCFVLGHLPNIIIKCECNGFLFFSLWTRSAEWLFQHRVLYWFITVSGASLLFLTWNNLFF